MPNIEQLVFGVNPTSPQAGRSVLAHSPGMGQEVSGEIIRFCEDWGAVPPLGLAHTVLMSFPLQKTMPSLRGKLFTVIRIDAGTTPSCRAVVLTEADYVVYGRNPYVLAAAGCFDSPWELGDRLDRCVLKRGGGHGYINPPPSPADVGLVDEALQQFLIKGTLTLPLEQSVPDSDRCLALLIAALPLSCKRELRFASFSTSEANNYTLWAKATEGSTFAGWRRLLMAQMAGGLGEAGQKYVTTIRDCLAVGDLAGLETISTQRPVNVAGRSDVRPKVKPEVITATMSETPRAGSETRKRLVPASQVVAAHKQAASQGQPSRAKRQASGRSHLKRVSAGTPFRGGRKGRSGLRLFMIALGLVIVSWCGFAWYSGHSPLELPTVAWLDNLSGTGGSTRSAASAGSLLEAVEVGDIYNHQMRRVARAGLGVLPENNRDRREALAVLQAECAGPLLKQVSIFVDLADAGIQQGSRPDRETHRLRALSQQGQVLTTEIDRLELAWHSFSQAVDWHDLGDLPDQAVWARRDSLERTKPQALKSAMQSLGTDQVHSRLNTACEHIDGMAALLALFQQPSLTSRWTDAIYQAAEKVSPSASSMTRAYRNSAFSLVRLKRAEQRIAAQGHSFKASLDPDVWIDPQVQDILPSLWKEAGKFRTDEAPNLLGGTIAWYKAMEKSEEMVAGQVDAKAYLKQLSTNPALKFDQSTFGDYLERLRFEAARRQLTAGTDPQQLPDHLFYAGDRAATQDFTQALVQNHTAQAWRDYSATTTQPFFVRWANHMATDAQQHLLNQQTGFDTAYDQWSLLSQDLRNQTVAGTDWTAVWLDLNQAGRALLDTYASELADDPDRQTRIKQVERWTEALHTTIRLKLDSVTIRLNESQLTEAQDVQLEITSEPGGQSWTSDPIRVGPSAPAGTGWVGTASLRHERNMLPTQGLRVRVLTVADGRDLLLVDYPPLQQRVGPGALARVREGQEGSLSFRLDNFVWQSLSLPVD